MKIYIILRNEELTDGALYQNKKDAECVCDMLKKDLPENNYEIIEREVWLVL